MSKIVLDASALIALLREEPGAPLVEPVLDEALISTVNLSEVHAKLIERGAPNDEAWASLVELDLEVVPSMKCRHGEPPNCVSRLANSVSPSDTGHSPEGSGCRS